MNTGKTKRAGKWISIFLMTAGLVTLSIPLYTQWQVKQVQESLVRELQEMDQHRSGDFLNEMPNGSPIGKISIPKIDLDVAVVKGVDQTSIKNAVGWMPSSSLPDNDGNMVLAGHRSYTFGKFFNRLGEVDTGDTIFIETNDGKHEYKVYDIEVVTPDDVSVLEAGRESEVTLITCEPLYSDKYRLIVKAEKINNTVTMNDGKKAE